MKLLELLTKKASPIVTICTTDAQLLSLTRALLPRLRDDERARVHFIGYNGIRNLAGEFIALDAPLSVIGTVDTRPHEQGSLLAVELLNVANGMRPRPWIGTRPTRVDLGVQSD